MNIVFFGSTSDSVIVLEKLTTFPEYHLAAVVTQPPRPVGRKQNITPTPVDVWAKAKNIPVLTFPNNPDRTWLYENEDTVINSIESFKPDLLVSAVYGQMIPWECITHAPHGGINIHPSLLPRWRGADPIPWTILSGDAQTGVSIVTLSKNFDEGKIIAQKKIPLTNSDMPDDLRTNLFEIGSQLLIDILPDYVVGKNQGVAQKKEDAVYARRLTRKDGFIPWRYIQLALEGRESNLSDFPDASKLLEIRKISKDSEAQYIDRMVRALSPWPGVWTTINGKRMKILETHELDQKLSLDTIQMEGEKPKPFSLLTAS